MGFMKTVVNFFETQRLMLGHTNTDILKGWRLLSNPDETDSKNLSYMNFVWQGDEVLIDNSETFNQLDPNRKITFGINKHLCHQMKWILENDDGTYQLAPNLKLKINGAKIPDPDASGVYEDLQTGDGKAVFFLAKDNYYFLSIHTNWRFLNLKAAYSNTIASPTRTLFVYSDASSSSVSGNQNV